VAENTGAGQPSWESVMMPKRIARFVKDRSGVTGMEYGLIALLVAVGIVASITLLGDSVSETFNTVATNMPD
jgi:pilus assembly protein Flp/PilA